MKTFLPWVLVFGFFLALFFLIEHKRDIQYVNIGGVKVKVELALTSEQKAQGLSGRSNLKEDEGLLFVFDTSDKYPFWMKDMNFSIDMIWIKEDGRILYIKKDAQPDSYPASYGPETPEARYVLEVLSGFSDRNNLEVGDETSFTY